MTDHLHTIGVETDRFAEVLRDADPAARVPTCPDWDAADLLWHLTEVHAFWAEILRSGALSDEESEAAGAATPARPDGREATLALLAAETDALIAELSRRADDEPAYFWLETAKTVGSTRRMQAHEATMHRVDAELTAGVEVSPIDPSLAIDGLKHAVEVMWAWWSTLPGFSFAPSGVVELRSSDAGSVTVEVGRWQGVGQSGKAYDVASARLAEPDRAAAATVTGTAAELYRWLWGRGAEPTGTGEEKTLEALRQAQAAGMQ